MAHYIVLFQFASPFLLGFFVCLFVRFMLFCCYVFYKTLCSINFLGHCVVLMVCQELYKDSVLRIAL